MLRLRAMFGFSLDPPAFELDRSAPAALGRLTAGTPGAMPAGLMIDTFSERRVGKSFFALHGRLSSVKMKRHVPGGLGCALRKSTAALMPCFTRYEIESSRHTSSHEPAVSMKPFPNRTGIFQCIRLSIACELFRKPENAKALSSLEGKRDCEIG